jgi:uncharacterized protein DUF1854
MLSKDGDPANFDLHHDAWGRLVLVDRQGVSHAPVEPVRGFPISDPDHWISICDAEGRELMVVHDLAALSTAMREVLEKDLARREFVPLIRRILSVPADTEPSEWEVETDRGRTRFLLTSGDDVRRLGPHRAQVIDSQGIRYLVDDTRQLDAQSRRILERYL